MFNTVESINDPYEWGKLADQVQKGTSGGKGGDTKDTAPAEVRFLNNQTESEVRGTLQKETGTNSHTIYLEHVDYHIEKLNEFHKKEPSQGYTQQDFFDSHFIFDNVISFSINGLRWNVPDCKYYDILIPSLPPEAFQMNMRNEPIISRQTGRTYYRQANTGTHDYPALIHGTGSFQGFDLNETQILRIKIEITQSNGNVSSTTKDIQIKKNGNYDSINNFINQMDTISFISSDGDLDIGTYPRDSNKLMITSGRSKGNNAATISLEPSGTDGNGNPINNIDLIKNLFGEDATINLINQTYENGYTEVSDISYDESFSVSATFRTPISIDFNNIPIYARFSDIAERKLKVLDERLIQVYPTNDLSFKNLENKYGISRNHSMQVEKHIHFQITVETKEKRPYDQ
jgi:hypothetical protein